MIEIYAIEDKQPNRLFEKRARAVCEFLSAWPFSDGEIIAARCGRTPDDFAKAMQRMVALGYIVPVESEISGRVLYRLGSAGRKKYVPEAPASRLRSEPNTDRTLEAHDLWAQRLSLGRWETGKKIWVKPGGKKSKDELTPDFVIAYEQFPLRYYYEVERKRKWNNATYDKLIKYMKAMKDDPNIVLRLVFKSEAARLYAEKKFNKQAWYKREKKFGHGKTLKKKMRNVLSFELAKDDPRRKRVRFMVKDIMTPCKLILPIEKSVDQQGA